MYSGFGYTVIISYPTRASGKIVLITRSAPKIVKIKKKIEIKTCHRITSILPLSVEHGIMARVSCLLSQ